MEKISLYDAKNKVVRIQMKGFADKSQVEPVLKDFQLLLQRVNPKEYTLFFDCTALNTFLPEFLPLLEDFYRMYMELEFKRVIIVSPQHLPSKMQLKRIGKKCDFNGIFVDSVMEAEQMLNS